MNFIAWTLLNKFYIEYRKKNNNNNNLIIYLLLHIYRIM